MHTSTLIALLAALTFALGAPSQAEPTSVSSGILDADSDPPYPEIIVNGRIRRCRPMAGDPLGDVDLSASINTPQLMTVIPDGPDKYVLAPNKEQITGPDYWQRTGVGLHVFKFRVPPDGKPMCVGTRADTNGFAGFRRIVDASPYTGRRVRFTAWVATEKARQLSFWLVAGSPYREKPSRFEKVRPNQLLNGGNTNNVRFGGSNGWTPVLLETGPIHEDADHISYGFNLLGSGDVWVYQPRLEIVTDQTGGAELGDRIVIGSERE